MSSSGSSADRHPLGRPKVFGRRKGRGVSPTRRARYEAVRPLIDVTGRVGAGGDRQLTADELAGLFAPLAPREIWIEIGFGGGEHIAHQARLAPDIGILGAEVFEGGIVKLVDAADREALGNVRIYTEDARMLIRALPDASIARAFLLFPDPWPKLRHHERRFVQGETLAELARVLIDGGRLRVASDIPDYVAWTRARLAGSPAFSPPAVLYDGSGPRPPELPVTRYEEKAIAAGRRATYLEAARRSR